MTLVVVRCQYQSVATPLPGNGKLRGALRRCFSCLRLGSPLFSGNTDRGRILNFCRHLTGWSIGTLVQPAKQPSCRITQSLRHSFVAPAFHEQDHHTGDVGNVQEAVGAIQNA